MCARLEAVQLEVVHGHLRDHGRGLGSGFGLGFGLGLGLGLGLGAGLGVGVVHGHLLDNGRGFGLGVGVRVRARGGGDLLEEGLLELGQRELRLLRRPRELRLG